MQQERPRCRFPEQTRDARPGLVPLHGPIGVVEAVGDARRQGLAAAGEPQNRRAGVLGDAGDHLRPAQSAQDRTLQQAAAPADRMARNLAQRPAHRDQVVAGDHMRLAAQEPGIHAVGVVADVRHVAAPGAKQQNDGKHEVLVEVAEPFHQAALPRREPREIGGRAHHVHIRAMGRRARAQQLAEALHALLPVQCEICDEQDAQGWVPVRLRRPGPIRPNARSGFVSGYDSRRRLRYNEAGDGESDQSSARLHASHGNDA